MICDRQPRLARLHQIIVTTAQMQEIESQIFAAGMPVAALMEKVAGLISRRIMALYPLKRAKSVGILVGSGHNGGDALVVARELYFQGYQVLIYSPFSQHKELTDQHLTYAQNLGIPIASEIDLVLTSDLLIDGLFGFGLSRIITDSLAIAIQKVNQAGKAIISIDLPSGIHTDTGEVLGIAIQATHTLCLGLWKLGLLQDQALGYLGKLELIDFDIPLAGMELILSKSPARTRFTPELGLANIPISKPLVTHKYQQGNLLLICGSQRYAGAAILAGLGARASGVGMLSIAVPASLKPLLLHHLPEALIIACPETSTGAISDLSTLRQDWQNHYSAIACGCGLSLEGGDILPTILEAHCPLLLDADGLNLLAQRGTVATLNQRQPPTILTPHWGEFKRLFPEISQQQNHLQALQQAAIATQSIILLKGARTAVASGLDGDIASTLEGCPVAIVPESTPALARGGSGDVLTGLIAGLVAQNPDPIHLLSTVTSGAWWHAQAGIWAATSRTDLGVDAFTLSQSLIPALSQIKERYSDPKWVENGSPSGLLCTHKSA